MKSRLPALLLLATTACATVNHGPMQRIYVDSEPVRATVQTRNCGPGSTRSVETPDVVWVSRRAKRCALTFRAAGYESKSVTLRRLVSTRTYDNARAFESLCDGTDCYSISEWLAMLFVGGLVAGTGFGVDAATGAMFELQPSNVKVELAPVAADQ
jgi:hypothetical protein